MYEPTSKYVIHDLFIVALLKRHGFSCEPRFLERYSFHDPEPLYVQPDYWESNFLLQDGQCCLFGEIILASKAGTLERLELYRMVYQVGKSEPSGCIDRQGRIYPISQKEDVQYAMRLLDSGVANREEIRNRLLDLSEHFGWPLESEPDGRLDTDYLVNYDRL